MATYTRQQLRRQIAADLLDPFFVAIPAGELPVVGTPGSVEEVPLGADLSRIFSDSSIFKGSHLYAVTGANTGNEYTIYDYDGNSGTVYVSPTPESSFQNGDMVEIHTRRSATAKHEAINLALESAYPFFWKIEDAMVVIPEDTTELTEEHGVPQTWLRLLEVWLEPPVSLAGPYSASIISNSQLTTEDVTFENNAKEDWQVRFVRGEDATGRYRTISTNDDDTLNWTPPLSIAVIGTPEPNEYRFVLADVQNNRYGHFLRQQGCYPNDGRFSSLQLGRFIQSHVGSLLRLVGIKEPDLLASDEDTTDVPLEYLVYHACSRLAIRLSLRESSSHAGSTQFIGRWDAQELTQIRNRLARNFPATTHWFIEPERNRGWQEWASNPYS